MKRFLFYFAIAGWSLGFLVHLLSILGKDVLQYFPYVWVLHFGIFVVWFPTILSLRKNEDFIEYQQSGWLSRMNPLAFLRTILKNSPTWLSVVAGGGFIYAIANFIMFMSPHEGSAVMEEGNYMLKNHGQLIRALTEDEYHQFQIREVRLFSGHWIAFYGIAAAVIFPFRKNVEER
jgi:hypothetical protein